ncbi:MAG: RNA polymerase sigma factor [Pseudonocardiaceae bacterium]
MQDPVTTSGEEPTKATVEAWARAVHSGDRAAFAHLDRIYRPKVLGYLVKQLGLREYPTALELTSQTMVAALESLVEKPEQPRALEAYLIGIARNLLRRHFTAQRRRYRHETDRADEHLANVPQPEVDSGGTDLGNARGDKLARLLELALDAVESLSPKYRDLVRAQQTEELGGEQLGVRFGLSGVEASRRLYDGRQRVRKIVAAMLVDRDSRNECSTLNGHLGAAGWTGGPFEEFLRRRILHHVTRRVSCKPRFLAALRGIRMPVVIVLIALELDAQHRKFVQVALASQSVQAPQSDQAPPPGEAPGHAGDADEAGPLSRRRRPALVDPAPCRNGGLAPAHRSGYGWR